MYLFPYCYIFLGHLRWCNVDKLDLQTYMSEFKSYWMPHSYSSVPHLREELSKLLLLHIASGLEDWGSIPGWVILKTQKNGAWYCLVNTQHYKVQVKGKVEQAKEWSSTLPNTLML